MSVASSTQRRGSLGVSMRTARALVSLAAAALFYAGAASLVVGGMDLSEDIAARDSLFVREAQASTSLEMSSATLRAAEDSQTERRLVLIVGGALGFIGGGFGFLLTRTLSTPNGWPANI